MFGIVKLEGRMVVQLPSKHLLTESSDPTTPGQYLSSSKSGSLWSGVLELITHRPILVSNRTQNE